MLRKIRNLWRFDGDEEPVTVSRRSFLSLSGVVLTGVALGGTEILATATGESATHMLTPGRPYVIPDPWVMPGDVFPVHNSRDSLVNTWCVVTGIDHEKKSVTLESFSSIDSALAGSFAAIERAQRYRLGSLRRVIERAAATDTGYISGLTVSS